MKLKFVGNNGLCSKFIYLNFDASYLVGGWKQLKTIHRGAGLCMMADDGDDDEWDG